MKRVSPYSALSLVRRRIHALRQSTELSVQSQWPRCLLWHGWLPGLNGLLGNKPWASSFGELAAFHLEGCLGAYPVDFNAAWTPPDFWDAG